MTSATNPPIPIANLIHFLSLPHERTQITLSVYFHVYSHICPQDDAFHSRTYDTSSFFRECFSPALVAHGALTLVYSISCSSAHISSLQTPRQNRDGVPLDLSPHHGPHPTHHSPIPPPAQHDSTTSPLHPFLLSTETILSINPSLITPCPLLPFFKYFSLQPQEVQHLSPHFLPHLHSGTPTGLLCETGFYMNLLQPHSFHLVLSIHINEAMCRRGDCSVKHLLYVCQGQMELPVASYCPCPQSVLSPLHCQ